MKGNSHPLHSLTSTDLWDNRENNVWLVSSLKFYRNLDKFKFPAKLEVEQRKQILNLIETSLLSNSQLNQPYSVHAETLSALDKEFLLEHFLSTESIHQARVGEAFVLDTPGNFIGLLNIRHHLQLQVMEYEGELEKALNKLIGIESEVGRQLNYAYSPRFGHLTTDIDKCGTGLTVQIYLHIPALIHTDALGSVLEKCQEDNILVTGLQGDPHEFIGDVIVLQNNRTLGVTEDSILSLLRSRVIKVIVEEQSLRSKVRSGNHFALKDSVCRAFGLLMYSYQIETIEALDAISLVKLGTDLGWISGITIKELNNLFFHCRRAHLINRSDKFDLKEVPKKRSQAVKTALKNASLTI